MRKVVLTFLALWMAAFYLAPILVAAAFSFLTPGLHGGFEWTATLKNYAYVKPELFWRTALFAVGSAVFCSAVALAVSIDALLRPSPAKSRFIFGLVAFTLVTNSLVKIYAWIQVLPTDGLWGDVRFRVALGLTYVHLPFAMLLIHEGVQSIDGGLIRAARDLGATDGVIARRILWPLARPFALTATFVVAVFGFAEFLVPEILGRGRVMLTGNRMADLFLKQAHWPACMAIGSVIVALLLGVLLLRRREA